MTTVSISSPLLTPQADIAKRFKKARAHSRYVRLFKFIIPVIVVIFAAIIAFFMFISPNLQKFNASIDGYKINGTKISMLSPNLTGFMKDNRPYRVRAERSEQDMKNPTSIDLFNMQGEFSMSGDGTALVKSVEGTMQTDKDLIEFRKNVTLTTSAGHFVSTSEAKVDAKAGTIKAPHAIELRSKTGQMTADSMDFQDGGKVIIFIGNIKGSFVPSSADENNEPKPNSETKQ